MSRVTIDDLAERLGLSRASVSYALNGRPGVGEATRSRVIALAVELGWQPSVSARSLSRSRADAVGIVLTRRPEDLGAEPFYMRLLSGVESALSETGFSLMIRFVPPEEDAEADVYRRWTAERRVDGVILTDLRRADSRPGMLDELSLPYLVHDGRQRAGGWRFDAADEAETLVDHLADLGHRRIGHVSGPLELLHETERSGAVRSTAARRGLTVTAIEGDYTLAGGQTCTTKLLADGDLTAILYSNDLMAVGGMSVADAAPAQLAVVSWDDSLLCQTAGPGITGLQRDPYSSGRDTANQLIARIEGDDPPPREHQPNRIVVRASSRPARAVPEPG